MPTRSTTRPRLRYGRETRQGTGATQKHAVNAISLHPKQHISKREQELRKRRGSKRKEDPYQVRY